jgi:hypothetical protein
MPKSHARKLLAVPELSNLTFEAAVEQIHALLRDEGAAQWKIGQLYNYIIDNKLAEQNGYRYAREFFAHEFNEVGRSSLVNYGAVAGAFTEVAAQTYGIAKLVKLLTYLKLMKQGLIEGDPGEFVVNILQLDGSTVSKRFADCTREDLAAAIRALRLAPSLPGADSKLLEQLQQALMDKLGEESNATIKGTWNGSETELSLTHVPLSQLRAVLDALTSLQS